MDIPVSFNSSPSNPEFIGATTMSKKCAAAAVPGGPSGGAKSPKYIH